MSDSMTPLPPPMVTFPFAATIRALCASMALIVTGGMAIAAMKPSTEGLTTDTITVTAEPIAAFDRLNSDKSTFGRLEWRGGLVLNSASKNFGGWSGLVISADGRDLLAVSDAGTWMRARVAYDGRAPRGLEDVELGPITSRSGKVLSRGRDRDAEGLSLVKGGPRDGEVLVSFEANHRIGRFAVTRSGLSAPKAYLPMPKELSRRGRDGLESVTVLSGERHKGEILAIGENPARGTDRHPAWLWKGNLVRPLSIVARNDFAVTDAATLPNGDLLILERRFRILDGVRMRIRRIASDTIKPGAVLDGTVLIEADMGQQIDNMEGLAVHTDAAGTLILTLISDDNFNPLVQRTLLLQFALPDFHVTMD